MDKYDFILDLIENKKLNSFQKERVIKLSLLELKKEGGYKNTELIKRIEVIEKRIKDTSLNEITEQEETIISGEKTLPKHKPKETYLLLSKFSSMDGGIKNLTHSFHSDFKGIEHKNFIDECKKEFEEGKKEYPNVPNSIFKKIEEFAFSENPQWYVSKGNEKIIKDIGWSSPKFIEWYNINKIHPADNDYYNKEMIIPFKNLIQVRASDANLPKMIDDLVKVVFGNPASINTKVIDNVSFANFFTDVDKLGQALFHIFSTIKHISSTNFCDEVEIEFEKSQKFNILKVTHIDSVSRKSANDRDFLGGDLNSIKNNLWGLCNYEIESKFSDGSFRKIILSDDFKGDFVKNEVTVTWFGKAYPIPEKDIKGFSHILKFY